MKHTVTLRRDNDRVGSHYGQHYYTEESDGQRVKIEYAEPPIRNRGEAIRWGMATAKIYGAEFVDGTPPASSYGWSAD